MSTTWQPITWYGNNQLVTDGGEQVNKVLFTTTPGVGQTSSSTAQANTAARPFDHPVVLERIHGEIGHEGESQTPTTGQAWFPLQLAAVKVPSEFAKSVDETTEAPSLLDNLDGDDFFFFLSCLCNPNNANNQVSMVDNKSKRRFEVGDAIAWIGTLLNPLSIGVQTDLTFNLRILWKHGS